MPRLQPQTPTAPRTRAQRRGRRTVESITQRWLTQISRGALSSSEADPSGAVASIAGTQSSLSATVVSGVPGKEMT